MGTVRSSEAGEGKIGCIFTLLILAAAVGVAMKLVPVYYSNSNLADTAGEVAGQAGLFTAPSLNERLRAKAAELGIPEAGAEGAMTVSVSGEKSSGTCTIKLNYTRVVDLYGVYSFPVETHSSITRQYMDAR